MKKRRVVVDSLMLIIMLLEYSKLHTGQWLHEVLGITLLALLITHNVFNINFYKNLLKGQYNFLRIITTSVNILFLLSMLLTIILGIPISSTIFKNLNFKGNMTVRKLHTIFGYWNLILLSIHLGFHFKIIFTGLKSIINNKKSIKIVVYLVEVIIVAIGIKAMIDINLGAYLIGKASFAIPTSFAISLVNKFSIVISIGIVTYQVEKLLLKREAIE